MPTEIKSVRTRRVTVLSPLIVANAFCEMIDGMHLDELPPHRGRSRYIASASIALEKTSTSNVESVRAYAILASRFADAFNSESESLTAMDATEREIYLTAARSAIARLRNAMKVPTTYEVDLRTGCAIMRPDTLAIPPDDAEFTVSDGNQMEPPADGTPPTHPDVLPENPAEPNLQSLKGRAVYLLNAVNISMRQVESDTRHYAVVSARTCLSYCLRCWSVGGAVPSYPAISHLWRRSHSTVITQVKRYSMWPGQYATTFQAMHAAIMASGVGVFRPCYGEVAEKGVVDA